MGDSPAGRLHYEVDASMQIQIMRPDRPRFAAAERLSGTGEELRAAFGGYLAYWGRWSVDEARGVVIHDVEGSLYPNWIGTRQERRYELRDDGNELHVLTQPMPIAGEEQVTRLVWRRLEPAGAW